MSEDEWELPGDPVDTSQQDRDRNAWLVCFFCNGGLVIVAVVIDLIVLAFLVICSDLI